MSTKKIYRQIIPEFLEPQRDSNGVVREEDMIDHVNSMATAGEFYELVEARVLRIYQLESDLDIIEKPNGEQTRDWKKLGTIDAVMIHNGEIVRGIQPLCSHFNCKPLKDERVILSEYSGRYYYSFPLASLGKVDHNREFKHKGEDQVFPALTFLNRPLVSGPGDTTIQGRFGNYINFGGDVDNNGKPAYPSIVIGNNQSADSAQNTLKRNDHNFPHIHNINSIGSSITLRSSPNKSSIQLSYDDRVPKFMEGDSIFLNSDELIMNAKSDDIVLTANDNINIGSNDNIYITTGDRNGKGEIKIGTKDPTTTTQPVVRGDDLVELLEALFEVLKDHIDKLENESPGVSALRTRSKDKFNIRNKLNKLKENYFSKILSKKVKVD